MGIRSRVFLIVFLSLGVSISIAYTIAERDITNTFEEQIVYQLEKQAKLLVENIDEIDSLKGVTASDSLADRLGNASDSRVTLILNDGSVIGDSGVPIDLIASLDDHSNRKEVIDALSFGTGWSSRYSNTTNEQLLYFAILDNNEEKPNIIRIAVPYTYLDRVITSLDLSILLIAVVAFFVAMITSTLSSNYTYKNLSELDDAVSSLADTPLKRKALKALPTQRVDEFGNVARSISQISDKLKTQVRLIAKQRNQFGSVLDDLGEGIIVFNESAEVTFNNDQALLILNLENIEKSRLEDIPITPILNLYETASKKKKADKEFEIDIGNGKTRWVLGSINQSKSTKEFILVVHDITQLRKLDSMRRDFISNVSHELRTPVSVIRANSETLLNGALDNKEDAKMFSTAILHNAQRLSEMVSDLIDLSRIEYGELKLNFEKINLNKSILKVLDSLNGLAAKKNISFSFNENLDVFVKADSKALERILINLIDNAIKYSPLNSSVEILFKNSEKNIEVNIIDKGQGIGIADKDLIFGRFFRTAQARASDATGSGLGLAIVKNLVHSLSGDVGLKNSSIKGCNFWFTLPKY